MAVWREGAVSRNSQATEGRAAEHATASMLCTSQSWNRETQRTSHGNVFKKMGDRSGQSSPGPAQETLLPWGALGFRKPTGHAAVHLRLGTAAPDPQLL